MSIRTLVTLFLSFIVQGNPYPNPGEYLPTYIFTHKHLLLLISRQLQPQKLWQWLGSTARLTI